MRWRSPSLDAHSARNDCLGVEKRSGYLLFSKATRPPPPDKWFVVVHKPTAAVGRSCIANDAAAGTLWSDRPMQLPTNSRHSRRKISCSGPAERGGGRERERAVCSHVPGQRKWRGSKPPSRGSRHLVVFPWWEMLQSQVL
jgi:hypothetical protein